MPTANPHLVGQIALQEGYVTPDQLEECLKMQESAKEPRPLGELLFEKGFLSREELDAVVKIQKTKFDTLSADKQRGGLFGQIAVRMGYVAAPHLNECLREQAKQRREGTSLQLGQLLLKKKYLTSERFLAVMRAQKKQVVKCPGCDTFYDVKERPGELKFACSNCNTVVEVPRQL